MRKVCSISTLLLTTLSLVACGGDNHVVGSGKSGGSGGSGNGSSSSSSTSGSGGGGGTGGGAACMTDGSSTLPGVSIKFTTTDCTYTLAEAAAGITIGYSIVVAGDIPSVYPRPQDTGSCDLPDSSGLIPFEELAGSGQKYCLCDLGQCPAPNGNPVTLKQGSYPGTFKWSGVNWGGPSDTLRPKGPPFPPGDYMLTVSAIGKYEDAGAKKDFEVKGTFLIHLVR